MLKRETDRGFVVDLFLYGSRGRGITTVNRERDGEKRRKSDLVTKLQEIDRLSEEERGSICIFN